MSYVCQVCTNHVPHGRPMRKHLMKRPDGSVYKELPVCDGCGDDLTLGLSVEALLAKLDRLGKLPPPQAAHSLGSAATAPGAPAPFVAFRPPGFETNGHPKPAEPLKAVPVCDLCGMPADGGQVTAGTTLCPKHSRKAKG